MVLDDFWLPFARRKTIGLLVLVYSTSIGTTVLHDISSILQTCLQKILGQRHHMPVYLWLSRDDWGVSAFFSQICPWWCLNLAPWRRPMLPPRLSSCGEVTFFLSHISASTQTSPHFKDTLVWNFSHYHLAGCWNILLVLGWRVGFFCSPYLWVSGHKIGCHAHQNKCLQGRRSIY